MRGARIELGDVWHRYPGSRGWALRGVSLSLEPGRPTILAGPNGAGKTTLLKVASALIRPSRGLVSVDGRDPWALGGRERLALRRRVVYVHDRPVMLRGSVAHNVAYGLVLRGLGRDEAFERALSFLEPLGMGGLAGVDAKRLSAGQAQLVAIARALAVEPGALLLDEPFSNLDRSRRSSLLEALEGHISRGGTLAIASHEEDYIKRRLPGCVVALREGLLEGFEC